MLGGGELLWALFFALGGIAFIAAYLLEPARWWAPIPGAALLAIAAPIALSAMGQPVATLGGPASLAILSFGFVAVYLGDRQARWWAIIPGGAILTLALVAALGTLGFGQEGVRSSSSGWR